MTMLASENRDFEPHHRAAGRDGISVGSSARVSAGVDVSDLQAEVAIDRDAEA